MINTSDHPKITEVIRYFEEFSKIPRGSGNTEKIADYLYSFGISRGLETFRDAFDNVMIKKPATRGHEDRPAVILQGHSDMVLAKEEWVSRDLLTEGIELQREGDFIKAVGTTLGADDGIALAYALAILDSSDIEHPRLECIFTSDEETGLTGAANISSENIEGRLMINIDSDGEGVFTVGCAGGARVDISLPVTKKKSDKIFYKLSLSGLLGGHSGVDIDKGRVNAIKLLASLLLDISAFELSELSGGNADNAIPREAYAVFSSDSEPSLSRLSGLAGELACGEDVKLKLERVKADSSLEALTGEKILKLIEKLPSGVYRMSEDIKGLVETSSNLGVCSLYEGKFDITLSVRSSLEEEKKRLIGLIGDISSELGASVSVRGSYPGWAYKKDSSLREKMIESYKRLYGSSPEVVMIHAGLECGLFSDKLEGLDCISLGPDNFDIHTPKERLSLSSSERVFEFILDVLKNI